jgi:hypothetical protein
MMNRSPGILFNRTNAPKRKYRILTMDRTTKQRLATKQHLETTTISFPCFYLCVKSLLNLQTMDRTRNEVVSKITIFSQKKPRSRREKISRWQKNLGDFAMKLLIKLQSGNKGLLES